jgi:hypothetical protein
MVSRHVDFVREGKTEGNPNANPILSLLFRGYVQTKKRHFEEMVSDM